MKEHFKLVLKQKPFVILQVCYTSKNRRMKVQPTWELIWLGHIDTFSLNTLQHVVSMSIL